MSNPTCRKLHAVTAIATAAVGANRFINFKGTHAGPADAVQGVSEQAAVAGSPFSVVTGYSALVLAAVAIPEGAYVGPSADGSGKADLGGAYAALSAAAAGELFEVRLQAGANLSPAQAAEVARMASACRKPLGDVLVEPPVSGITATPGAGLTLVSSTAETYNGEVCWKVVLTATSGTNNYCDLQIPVQTYAFSAADMLAEWAVDDVSKLQNLWCYLGTAGYAVNASVNITPIAAGTTAAWNMNGLTGYPVRESLWTKSGFADDVGNQAWVNAKVRVFVNNGATMTFYLRSIRVNANRKKARLAFVADDGHTSFFNMGVPILREFGFVSTAAIIRDKVGVNVGITTLPVLRRYVAEGNECVAHGPNDGGAGNNLWDAWATDAQRLADVNTCRDWLLANGLTSDAGSRCYVWPQGIYCADVADLSFISLLKANGYTLARGITANGTHYAFRSNGMSAGNLAQFALPILGHTWVSAGGETTNVPGIVTKIQNLGATRTDGILMLHKVVGVDAASGPLEISSNRLREIAAGAKAEVDAGRLEVVLLSEFAK